VDDVRLTDSELYDQLKAAAAEYEAAKEEACNRDQGWDDPTRYALVERRCNKAAKVLIDLWHYNRDRVRFMVWSDAEHEPPADLVCFASHTPEPPHEPAANKAEVFRFQLPYLSNIWRDTPTLARWVSEELIRNDLPGLVLVSGSNGNGFVTVEAFYNVNLIQSAGVYIAADNKGSN
jgi:hypothetical protein